MEFDVLPQTYNGDVWLRGEISREVVKIIAAREMLEAGANRGSLSELQLVRLAMANAALLSQAGLAMFRDGLDSRPTPDAPRQVTLTTDAPLQYRAKLSSSVLDIEPRWVDPATGK